MGELCPNEFFYGVTFAIFFLACHGDTDAPIFCWALWVCVLLLLVGGPMQHQNFLGEGKFLCGDPQTLGEKTHRFVFCCFSLGDSVMSNESGDF